MYEMTKDQGAFAEKTNEELISMYQSTKDDLVRQEILMRYSYIVKMIAMQMRGLYVDFAEIGDVINECFITLMAVLDNFDSSKNVKFESYASLRMRGTIIDLARKNDWLPRRIRKTAKMIDNAELELFSGLGRHPTNKEMAEHLGMDLDKYLKVLGETNLNNVLSLDEMMDAYGRDIYDTLASPDASASPEKMLQKGELSRVLQEAIESLRDNEKLTISLYYRKGLNMREIAHVLGVKEPRVSQIHANAIRKLRLAMAQYMKN
jgi:RNA polymerase sigma factor for flagellar operon FliA